MTTKPEVSLQPTEQTALEQLLSDPDRLKDFPIETVERMFELNLKLQRRRGRGRDFSHVAFNRCPGRRGHDAGQKATGQETTQYHGSISTRKPPMTPMAMLDPIVTVNHGFSRSSLSTDECAHREMTRIRLRSHTSPHSAGHEERHFLGRSR